MNTVEAFLEIVEKFTDPTWGKIRDDLISKVIKILRKYKEGGTPEELKDSKLVEGLEDFYERLFEISSEVDVEGLIEALGSFIKSPVPCKLKIIGILNVLLKKGY